jgi:hypothetical protein
MHVRMKRWWWLRARCWCGGDWPCCDAAPTGELHNRAVPSVNWNAPTHRFQEIPLLTRAGVWRANGGRWS